ncbi:MAG TPA: hypothetical protein DCW90_23110 [Lachnospiraceae bacterium]|nr:hypothetical protein [Lachnospiraceae bacterium]
MATVDVEQNPLASLYDDITDILDSIIIKYSYNAEMYETFDIRKYTDQYLDALEQKDTFYTYDFATAEYMTALTLLNPDFTLTDEMLNQIHDWQRNPVTVPENIQTLMLETKREEIITSYDEPNNYYRMLHGYPDIEESEKKYFYIDDALIKKYELQDLHLENYGIPQDLPLHKIQDELGTRYINILESLGVIDKLRTEYPEKSYLNFLGAKRIEYDVARKANNFSILRMNYNVRQITSRAFYDIYEQCRLYFVDTIYIPQQRNVYDYYDNFIALSIMVMTLQQLFSRTISYAIDREFYDDYMVQLLYSVYGIPYESRLTYDIQRRIVKNLNLLIQNKATNKVIYDIAYILGFHRIQIKKYYLVKERRFDSKGNLIYKMKDTLDDYGNKIGEEYDLGSMYNVYFQKVDLNSENIPEAIMDPSNYQDYESLTMDDPFWWEDESLFSEIYEREWNFAETKYLGLTISYKLSELMFENVLLLKMVFDLKDQIEGITVDLPKILEDVPVTLFETIVFLCAAVCKKYGIKGEIITDVSKILHILDEDDKSNHPDLACDTLSFNFRAVSSELINPVACPYTSCGFYDNENAERRCKLKDSPCAKVSHLQRNLSEIQRFLTEDEKKTMDTFFDDLIIPPGTMEDQIKAFNRLYGDVKGLYKFISNKLSTTSDINEYQAYKNLYRALYISKETNAMFKKGFTEDSPIATTYLEYLHAMNPSMANYIENANEVQLYNAIDHVISQLEYVVGNLDTLYLVNDGTSILQDYLLKLIRFFKSYTTQLVGLGIIYVFDTKPDNMLRFIDNIGKIHKTIVAKESTMSLSYADYASLHAKVTIDDNNMKFTDRCFIRHSDPTE